MDTSAIFSLPRSPVGELRWPTATHTYDGWVVAANLLPKGLDAQFARRSLYVAHSRVGLMPVPEGDFFFARPLVRFSSDGTLHLFWSEGAGREAPTGWPLTMTSVWHASFVNGRWSPAECIVRGKWLWWESRSAQVAIDDRGRLHLAVSVADTGKGGEHTVHLTEGAAGWEKVDTGVDGLQVALVSLSGGRLVMSYVDYEKSSGATNQLYTISSADYGKTWQPAARALDRGDTAEVHHSQLRVVGDTLVLSWLGAEGPDGTTWSLSRRVSRTNSAESWSRPVRSALPRGVVFSVTSALSGCGDVAAFAEMMTPGMAAVVLRVDVRNGAAQFKKPFGDAFAMSPLMERSGDRIIALWNARDAGSGVVQTFFRERRTCP